MSALTAVDAVWNRLKVIDGVGPNVYNMLRNSKTEGEFKQIFLDATTDPDHPIVRAWRVTRVGTMGKDSPFMNTESDTHDIEISGFMAFQDGVSEPIFQQVIENIRFAFNPLSVQGSAIRRFVDDAHPLGQFDWSGPLQIVGPRLGMLGQTMVHAVLMNYPVQEFPL
jgi:hypothetical protein